MNPLNDSKLKSQLQQLDRDTHVDATSLAKQVSNRVKTRRRMLQRVSGMAIVAAGGCFAVAVWFSQLNDTTPHSRIAKSTGAASTDSTPPIKSSTNESALRPDSKEPMDASFVLQMDPSILQQEVLLLKESLDTLKRRRGEQSSAITREVLSRTEIETPAIAAYFF